MQAALSPLEEPMKKKIHFVAVGYKVRRTRVNNGHGATKTDSFVFATIYALLIVFLLNLNRCANQISF